MIFIFYFLAAVLVFVSWKSFRGGLEYLKFFRRERSRPEPGYTPFASVIVPCRGLDAGLEENLGVLFRQDYPRYEVIFVVDDEADEAVQVIKRVIESNFKAARGERPAMDAPARIIAAGKASGESQKVHNLREAVLHVSDESEVFVFVDSDARPHRKWLRFLIGHLSDDAVGAATGYRWFISRKRNLASEMRSAWNASVASALGANTKSNFCWGGSMALRRATFEKIDMRRRWRGTLSDDFAVTRAVKEAGLAVSFVPQSLTASVDDCSWRELMEFTTRQMKITRVYAPHLWRQTFIGSALFNIVFVWGVFVLWTASPDSFAFRYALAALLLTAAFSTGKSWLRLKAVRLVLPEYESDLKKQFLTQNTLWIFVPALFFINDLAAWLSRRIVWRGISYELRSAEETLVVENSKV